MFLLALTEAKSMIAVLILIWDDLFDFLVVFIGSCLVDSVTAFERHVVSSVCERKRKKKICEVHHSYGCDYGTNM